jgi:DNA-binding beta-propeller fold protein YncE
MKRRVVVAAAWYASVLLWAVGTEPVPPRGPSPAAPSEPVTLEAVAQANGCLDEGAAEAAAWPEWDSPGMLGGDVPPARVVSDPYPTFHSVAVDAEHNRVVMTDSNRMGVLTYERTAASTGNAVTKPLTHVRGPATAMMFVAGVAIDPARQEIYTVDNDIGDRMLVFPYDANGNARPKRVLHVPHQAWGLSLNKARDEVAVTVEGSNLIVIFRREASGEEQPVRLIRGGKTGLGDPHGVFFDGVNDELVVANHGNRSSRQWEGEAPVRARDSGEAPREASGDAGERLVGGRFEPPSITVFAGTAKGNTAPLRTIQGPKTQLDWPMGVDVDTTHNEVAVANNGGSSVLVFSRTAAGDVAPIRVLRGALTGIDQPMGVAIDVANDELWVPNYNDHTALVFPRTASGNVAPKRIIRNAPAGAPTGGFGNPGAVAYDTKRGEILVPN